MASNDISPECEQGAHEDCSTPDTCECPCHEAQKAAIRAMDDVLERSAGAVTTRDPRTIPHGSGDHGASNWEADRRQRSFYAPSSEAADLYHPTSPEYDERASEIERAEALGMGVVSRIIDQTRREISGQKVPKGKPGGRCSVGHHAVDINALSTVDAIAYRKDGQCPAARAGEQCGGGLLVRLRWPWRKR